MEIISDKVLHKINWPTILIVVALLAGFYYFFKPEAVVKVNKSIYKNSSITPELKMAQLEEGVEEPKQKTVNKFYDLTTKVYRVYRISTREEIDNSLILIYNMRRKEYNFLTDFATKL